MPLRIGITGAPFAGKTQATKSLVDIPGLIVVPEAATLLYEIGFPKPAEVGMKYKKWLSTFRPLFVPARIAIQKALEDSMIIKAEYVDARAIICDRMIGDAVSYYRSAEEFLSEVRIAREEIFARYDVVLFLESYIFRRSGAAQYNRRMPPRLARASNKRLLELYQAHPRFHFVEATADLTPKMHRVRELILEALEGS